MPKKSSTKRRKRSKCTDSLEDYLFDMLLVIIILWFVKEVVL